MGRPREEGLKYFNIDCVMDEKIEILESEFGLEGFAIYIKLLQEAYKTNNGIIVGKINTEFSRWKTLGKRWGIPFEQLKRIIQFQVDLNLWNKKEWIEEENLTSSGIQKRLKRIHFERKKDRERKENLNIDNFPTGKQPENNRKTTGKLSEKCTKERKGKERKGNISKKEKNKKEKEEIETSTAPEFIQRINERISSNILNKKKKIDKNGLIKVSDILNEYNVD